MSGYARELAPRLAAWRRLSIAVGLLASIALAIGGYLDPQQLFRAYLGAYVSILGLALGSLSLLMIYHLTGGAWGFLIRRPLEQAVRTLPLVAIAFLPISLGKRFLYPFAQPDVVEHSDLLQFQQRYLNEFWFDVRAVGYFSVWIALGFLLLACSRRQAKTGDTRYARWCEYLSGPGLVLYGVTIHFASVDWLMSLQPAFHSTIFGPVVASGQILSAAALAVVILLGVRDRPPLAEWISLRALNDLGNLLLAFVVVWGYLGWAQYMLIWIANLPTDVVWYAPRMRGAWRWCAWGLLIFGFAFPMLALLWRSVKRDVSYLALVASMLLVAQAAFNVYQVSPAFALTGLRAHWLDFDQRPWRSLAFGLRSL